MMTYPGLDISPPALPPRSRLYHLQPLGIGTERVESLTSYVARLAAAHSVSILTLIVHQISPRLTRRTRTLRLRGRFSDGCVMLPGRGSFFLNGSGRGAEDWVRVLGQLTGEQNLRFLTALCWGNAVSVDEFVRRHRVWCPQCYQEWQEVGRGVGEALLWAFQPVAMCPFHLRPLVARCPNCHRAQHVLYSRMHPGFCSHCQIWLGSSESARQSAEDGNPQRAFMLWASTEISGFLRVAPSAWSTVSCHALRENLNTCRKHLARRGRTFASIAEVSDSQMSGCFRLGYAVKITPLMRISYRTGIPILDLLTCPPEAFQPDWSRIEENLNRTVDRESTRHTQPLAVNADVGPPPLSRILEISGYKAVFQLRRRNSQLHRELVIKHREARRAVWKEKLRKDRAGALAAIKAALESSLALDCPDVLHVTASQLDFETPVTLINTFPELTAAIIAKRARWKQRCWKEKEALAWRAVMEAVPPTVEALARRLGFNTREPLRKRFPAIVTALTARASERTQARRAMAQKAMEAALGEVPPPSFKEISRRAGLYIHTLHQLYPELTCTLRSRYREWREERSQQAVLLLEREVGRAVSELHAQHLYPSYSRVRPLLPVGMRGANIAEIVSREREQLGIPKYHSPSTLPTN